MAWNKDYKKQGNWQKKEMFECLMAERHLDEHTGGRKKKPEQ